MHLPDNILHVFVIVRRRRLGVLKADCPGLIFALVSRGVLDTALVPNSFVDRGEVAVIVVGAVAVSARITSFRA